MSDESSAEREIARETDENARPALLARGAALSVLWWEDDDRSGAADAER